MRFFLKSAIFSLVFCGVACTPVHRGYKMQEGDVETMKSMVERSAKVDEIVNKFGSPTFINAPINDNMCYASGDGTRIAFARFARPTYNIVCISFKDGVATGISNKKFNDIDVEKFV
ncbi:MAG: hypothetical protein IJT14_01505, partial [Rickettsiales bacterium]|nr:hypothetical protein [Rickettsiales bacterium]